MSADNIEPVGCAAHPVPVDGGIMIGEGVNRSTSGAEGAVEDPSMNIRQFFPR